MTMDQCLNCSRYEPIIGQIYDILDDSGMNLSAILDDNQMSYMGMSDYISLNRVEEFHDSPKPYSFDNTIKNNEAFKAKKDEAKKKAEEEIKAAKKKLEEEAIKKQKEEEEKLKKEQAAKEKKAQKDNKENSKEKDNDKDGGDAESVKPKISAADSLIVVDDDKLFRDIDKNVPKPFKAIWPKGFVMDWSTLDLETQTSNINEYKYENTQKYSEEKYDPNKKKFEDGFKDTRKEADEYEYLEYSSDEFNIDFGNSTLGGMAGGIGFGNGSAIRSKITARAQEIINLCAQGKARYTHARPYGPQSNGWSEWDCSAFTHDCYKTAGITLTCPHTTEQFQQCNAKNGGMMFKVENCIVPKEALPGDILFFAGNGKPSDPLNINAAGSITHVGIYAGDNMMYHSGHHHSDDSKQDIVKIKVYSACIAVGRPKALVEADKQANCSSGIGGLPTNISADLRDAGMKMKDNASCTIKNMQKYGFKNDLLRAAKQYNVDPYLILSMICTESTGIPTCGSGTYVGLMQTPGGQTGNNYNDICTGIKELKSKLEAMRKYTGVTSYTLAVMAYNAGEGSINNVLKQNHLKPTIDGFSMSPYLRDYVHEGIRTGKLKWGNINDQTDEKYKYFSRLTFSYNFLKQAKALGF